jgi:hypothetical protein
VWGTRKIKASGLRLRPKAASADDLSYKSIAKPVPNQRPGVSKEGENRIQA